MCEYLKKYLLNNLLTALLLGGLYSSILAAGLTANALVLMDYDAVDITKETISLSTFNPKTAQTTKLDYCLNVPAKITLGIYKPFENSSKKVNMLSYNEIKTNGCYSAVWNGQYGYLNEIGTAGIVVEDGKYFYYIQAESTLGSKVTTDSSSGWIYVSTDGSVPADTQLKIVDVDLESTVFDPWDDQNAEITFTINQKADITLDIFDEDNEKVITVINEKPYEKGEYTIKWNGENEFGNIVSQDEYSFKLKAKNSTGQDTETGNLRVKKGYDNKADQTEDPRIKNIFVTKDSFDPGRKEKEYIVFTLTAKADVQITIYDKDDKKIVKLLDENNKQPGNYVIQWEGSEVIDKEGTYSYQIYAKNAKGEDTKNGTIKVSDDDEDKKTSNLFKDTIDSIPYSPKNANLGISFKLEKAAKITVEIRDSKHLIATVVEPMEFTEGSHVVYWDGRDKDGDVAEDGMYKYKITATNNKGKEVEEGNFLISGSTQAKYQAGVCGQFTDVGTDNKYCEAIEWAVGAQVFQGYNDGSFKPNQPINRAEALKVILKALNVKIISSNGESLGFSDTDRFAWYATFIKTAVSLGIVHGYQDGTFKPNLSVNRIEALTMLLNAGKAKNNLIIPTNNIGQPYYDTPNTSENKWFISYVWFSKAYSLIDNDFYFYPSQYMTRAEMADMLYRYHKNNFDSN